jgi:hypothetical protein
VDVKEVIAYAAKLGKTISWVDDGNSKLLLGKGGSDVKRVLKIDESDRREKMINVQRQNNF